MNQGRRCIVVGVDGSAASVAALRWAAVEAARRRAELHVVYVWDRPLQHHAPYATRAGLPDLEQDRAAAAAILSSSVRAALGSVPAVALRAELAEGRAERVLLDRAVGAELLVLGSTARPGVQAEASPVHSTCLRKASCPVLIIGGTLKPLVCSGRRSV